MAVRTDGKAIGGACTHLAKVDLVEDNLIGVGDSPEARPETQQGYDNQGDLVVPFLADFGGGLGVRARQSAIDLFSRAV